MVRGIGGGRNQSVENFREMKGAIEQLSLTLNGFIQSQQNLKKINNSVYESEKKLTNQFETRNAAFNKAKKTLNEAGHQFEIFSLKSLKAFRSAEAGGNIFEYLDLALSSASQQVKIFGFEAAVARKTMYGFMPPGMFRAVNKLSTGFRFFGGLVRKLGDDGAEANNMFTTMGKKMANLSILSANPFSRKGVERRENKERLEYLKRGGNQNEKTGRFMSKVSLQLEQNYRQDEFNKTRAPMIKFFKKIGSIGKAAGIFAKKTWQNKSWKGVRRIIKSAWSILLKPMITFLIMGMFYLAMISAVIAAFKDPLMAGFKAAWSFIQEAWKNASGAFTTIWEGVTTLWDGLMSGDLMKIIEGVWTIAWGALQVVIGIGMALLGSLWEFVQAFAKEAVTKFTEFIGRAFSSWDGFKRNFGKIMLLITVVVGLIFGWPVALGLVFISALGWAVKAIGNIIPGLASGGVSKGGITMVGERGPELVNLPRNSRVHSNSDSRKMMGNNQNTINITINARDTSDSELRRIADKIGSMVNNKINRSSSSRTMG
tara:strand:- start:5200 stop:6825 length:1626 start_codon:yes stop_codon:yes gene_type:complete